MTATVFDPLRCLLLRSGVAAQPPSFCDCSGWTSSHIVTSLGTPVSLGRALSSLKKVGAVLLQGRNEAYAENVAHSVENLFLSHRRVGRVHHAPLHHDPSCVTIRFPPF